MSGYNLTIIISAVTSGLKRLSRFQILYTSLALIYLFLLITGYSPSIIRAAIVATLGLLAWYFGRQFRPILLIAIAAAITGFINPYYVWGDIGWFLLFLANIIVVPMVPFAMLFSLIAGLAGMLAPVMSGWFAIPPRILLNILLWVANWLLTWPGANMRTTVTVTGFMSLYIITAIVILGLKKRAVSVTIEQRRTNASEV